MFTVHWYLLWIILIFWNIYVFINSFFFLEYDNNYDNYNNEYDGYNSPHDDYDPDMVKKEEPDEENSNGGRYSNNMI